MAMTVKVDGMETISMMLKDLGDKAEGIASRGLYEGAGIMADEIRKEAGSIKTGPGASRESARYATPEEKQIVMDAAAGIAKFKKNGTEVDTSIGFRNAGYANLNGRTVPIPKIVNAINSGTSFMHKQPFVRKAANRAKGKASEAIRASIDTDVNAITNK